MTKAKVLGRKRVPHLMRPGVKGMALNARLHPIRTDLLPEMLLSIPDDVLHHVVRQRIVRFIVDGDTRHGNAPLPSGHGAAAWCRQSAEAHLRGVAIRSCSLLTVWH